jgi:hypothetical protein
VLALMLEDSKRRLQRRLTAVGMVVVERPHTCCHCMGRGEIGMVVVERPHTVAIAWGGEK